MSTVTPVLASRKQREIETESVLVKHLRLLGLWRRFHEICVNTDALKWLTGSKEIRHWRDVELSWLGGIVEIEEIL